MTASGAAPTSVDKVRIKGECYQWLLFVAARSLASCSVGSSAGSTGGIILKQERLHEAFARILILRNCSRQSFRSRDVSFANCFTADERSCSIYGTLL